MVAMAGDGDRGGEARRVRDEVGEAALERGRPHGDDRLAVEHHGRLVAVALGVAAQLLEEFGHVGRRRRLAGIAAREREIRLDHARHLVDVLLQPGQLRPVLEQRQLELEAGQQRAQVVRDAGQHGGALLHRALHSPFHLHEGVRGAPHLARAARAEVRHLAPLAEALGRIRERQDRSDLVAQEQDRDAEQDHRGAHHPHQEDVGVGRVGGAAPGEHPHHRVVEQDADLDQRRAADRIDPERPLDLLADLLRQRLIEQREERLGSGRRQIGAGQEVDHAARAAPGRCVARSAGRHPADRCGRRRSARRYPA